MTYLKLISQSARRHLVPPGQDPGGITTLCGCTITRARNWRVIAALEGDECEKCANLSFSLSRLGKSLEVSDCDSRQRTSSPAVLPS
jgi:hypothetical protein